MKTMPKTFRSFVKNLPDEFLVCRARRFHTLGAYTVGWNDTVHCYEQVEICSMCTTKRKQKVDAGGFIVGGSTYTYPPGYVMEDLGFMGRAEMAAVRLERIRRAGGMK